jgi:putative ABC transport system ATP-binding protein
VEALRGVTISIHPGELVALVGSSGAGKTTLLNLVGCLDRPTSGSIRLEGEEIQNLGAKQLSQVRRRKIGFVFQDAALIPTITALENVGLPLSFDRKGRASEGVPESMLEQVGLSGKGGRFPSQLSGGERQRVAIARALVHRPSLLLADEPTGNLDSENGRKIYSLFRELVTTRRLSALVATHNEEMAGAANRRIHLLDGRIVEGGVP